MSFKIGMARWGISGPGFRTKGFPRKELRSVASKVIMKPTAT